MLLGLTTIMIARIKIIQVNKNLNIKIKNIHLYFKKKSLISFLIENNT